MGTDWLNDAVKGYLSTQADFDEHLELANLKVLTASPEYLLAMKCLAMRLGEEFQDDQDVRFLLRYLNITRYEAAVEMVARYCPIERVPQTPGFPARATTSAGFAQTLGKGR